ncbi:MAG TPA: hypothetical protein VG759_22690, partial [Candidatus Angelobacter sp.]|nr:hypothetical protein [Candidatus Angelobacter sp.]
MEHVAVLGVVSGIKSDLVPYCVAPIFHHRSPRLIEQSMNAGRKAVVLHSINVCSAQVIALYKSLAIFLKEHLAVGSQWFGSFTHDVEVARV